jgi:aspartate aminotransferase-like enzyme
MKMTELSRNNFAKFYQASGKLLYTPGPTAVPMRVLQAMSKPIINPDLDPEFPFWFLETSKMMGNIMQTENEVLLLPGEGMLALDAAINSIVEPKDKVLVLASGIFGHGFADMVKGCGAEPIVVATKGYDDIITAAMVEEALLMFPSDNVTKHLMLLTDAMPTVGSENETIQEAAKASDFGITISLIGIGLDKEGKRIAEKIVDAGGGKLYTCKEDEEIDRIVLEDYYRL